MMVNSTDGPVLSERQFLGQRLGTLSPVQPSVPLASSS